MSMDKETFRKIRDLIFIAGLVLAVALNIIERCQRRSVRDWYPIPILFWAAVWLLS